ncbi:MAG: AraC family transcriptional regulator [Sporolactobacillus sp.]
MNDILLNRYEPCLELHGFQRYVSSTDEMGGVYYEIKPEKGRGFFWAYAHRDEFVLSVLDFFYYEDLQLAYEQPSFMSIEFIESISGEEFSPHPRKMTPGVQALSGRPGSYCACFHKNTPFHCICIDFLPPFIERHAGCSFAAMQTNWQQLLPREGDTARTADLIYLLKQIKNFRGNFNAAHLYFQGKAVEALALMVNQEKIEPVKAVSICKDDLEALHQVAAHLNRYYDTSLNLDDLARQACMGKTKLKYLFKHVYLQTLSDYVFEKRLTHAKALLLSSESSIHEIAQRVGYAKSSSLSSLFKKKFGITPCDYRKKMMHSH